MNKYKIVIYWSDEDQVFVAEVPELPGCMAHGSTQVAALTSANEAIQLWLDTANEFGDTVPKPRSHSASNKVFESKAKLRKTNESMSVEHRNNPLIVFHKVTSQLKTNPKAH